MIRIKMFGNGVRVWVCDLEEKLFHEFDRLRGDQNWEAVLTDYDFLEHFGFDHWSELANGPEIIGLKPEFMSVIEIKRKTKKLGAFNGAELIEQQTLFPLYSTFQGKLIPIPDGNRRILLLEHETGQTHSFKVSRDEILMSELEFQLQEFGYELYCTGIKLNNHPLLSDYNDTVTRGLRVIIIK